MKMTAISRLTTAGTIPPILTSTTATQVRKTYTITTITTLTAGLRTLSSCSSIRTVNSKMNTMDTLHSRNTPFISKKVIQNTTTKRAFPIRITSSPPHSSRIPPISSNNFLNNRYLIKRTAKSPKGTRTGSRKSSKKYQNLPLRPRN